MDTQISHADAVDQDECGEEFDAVVGDTTILANRNQHAQRAQNDTAKPRT
jgi:hypothetical protein